MSDERGMKEKVREKISLDVSIKQIQKGVSEVLKILNKDNKYEIDQEIEEVKNDLFFHYTNTDAMDKIMSTGIFWASNLFYLNDSTEYYNGIKKMEKLFEEAEEAFPDIEFDYKNILKKIKKKDGKNFKGVYAISFAENGDSLHHWNSYAKESGVCIAFDRKILEKGLESNERISLFYNNLQDVDNRLEYEKMKLTAKNKISADEYAQANDSILPVCYFDWEIQFQDIFKLFAKVLFRSVMNHTFKEDLDIYMNVCGEDDVSDCLPKEYHSDYINFCKKFGLPTKPNFKMLGKNNVDQNLFKLVNMFENYAVQFFESICAYSKSKAFGQEFECRAIFSFSSSEYNPEIKYFRQSTGILRPYIEILFKKISLLSEEESVTLPIRSITVGPSGRQQVVFDSIVNRIRHGKNLVWDYTKDNSDSEQGFSELFEYFFEYVREGIKDYRESEMKVSCDYQMIDSKILASILFDSWMEICQEANRNNPCYSEKEKLMREYFTLQLNRRNDELLINGDSSNVHKDTSPPSEERIENVIDYIQQNHYFSKEGIWIKKSKISFIFG